MRAISHTLAAALWLLATATVTATNAAAADAKAAYVCDSFPRSAGISDAQIVSAPDGSVWYTDTQGNRLMRVAPDRSITGVVPVDAATARLSGLALGPDGALWYSKDTSSRIGRVPLAGGTGTEYALPKQHDFPNDLKAGADGNLWYHDPVKQNVGRITPSGQVTVFEPPRMGGSPFMSRGLAIGPDGAVWVTVMGHNAVYRVDTGSGAFTRFDIPTPVAQPRDIVTGPDGNLWFTMPAVRKIGRITLQGTITEYDVGDTPTRLASAGEGAPGGEGALWVSFSGRGTVGRFDVKTGRLDSVPCGANPGAMAMAADGKLWVLGNGRMFVVSQRGQGAQAVVAATAAVPAPPVAAAVRGIENVPADKLYDRLAALPGRVLVQFSSSDRGCPFCITGNAGYEALAARRAGDTRLHLLRVMFEPWHSVGNSPLRQPFDLGGLPVTLAFENSKVVQRQMGTAKAEALEAALLRDLPAR